MGKRKKVSNRQQSTSYAQEVEMQNTAPAKVDSEKTNEKTNSESSICCGMTLLNLTSKVPQTLNDPVHMDSTELHDLLHIHNKHLATPSTTDQCLHKQNDKQHINSDEVSGKTKANTELILEKSPSLGTSETEKSSTSAKAEPTVTAPSHIIDQQNVSMISTKNAMQRHLDSYSTSTNRTSHANIKTIEITSQPTEFIKITTPKSTECQEITTNFDLLQSPDITVFSQSTLSEENTMKTRNDISERKYSVSDLGKKPEILLESTQLSNDRQNSTKTVGPTTKQDNEKQHVAGNVVTKTEIITEKMSATKVSQCIPELLTTENTTQNTDNKEPTTDVNKESNVSKHLTAYINTLSEHEYESNTGRAADMKMDQPPMTEKLSTPQITLLANSVTHQKYTSPVISPVDVPIKSDLLRNEGIHVGLAAATGTAGISTNTPSTSVWLKCSTQKTASYLSQEDEVAKLCTEATEFSATRTAAVGNGGAEDANINSNVSHSTQKSKHISSHADRAEELDKAVPLILSSNRMGQGSADTEHADGENTSQSTFLFSGHSTQNSMGSPSHTFMVARLSKEEPANSLTTQSGVNTENDDVRMSTTQNLFSNATNHRAEVSEFSMEVVVLSLTTNTTNTEARNVPAALSTSRNEVLSVVGHSNTNETIQICAEAEIKDIPSKTTKVKAAKQQTSLDTSVSNTSLPAVSKPLESTVLPKAEGPFKRPDVMIKQTETQNKCSISTKWHGPADTTHVVEEVVQKTGTKNDDSSHQTKGAHEIDNNALNILEEIPVKTSEPLRNDNNTFCTDESADKDVQIPNKKLDNEKKDKFIKNLTGISKYTRSKGTHTSHISIRNQFSNNKERSKVIIHENKTDIKNSQTKGNGAANHTDNKLKIIKADGETNKIFTSRDSFTNVCKMEVKSVISNEDTKTFMNAETSEKSKHNFHAQSTRHDLRSNQRNKNNSTACNKNVKRHNNKMTQKSITDISVYATNKEETNDQAQQRKKKHRRNRGKNVAQEGNETGLRQEKDVASGICSYKDKKKEYQIDLETLKVGGEKNEVLKSEYSSQTTRTKEEPGEIKSGISTEANNKVSTTLSKEHVTRLTRIGPQQHVMHNSARLETTIMPDIIPSQLAQKLTNIVSTVDDEGEMEYKLVQRHIFLTYVCHVCKSLVSSNCSLKKCSNCKMISYCSKEHQKEHWAAHKDLCKVISKICKQNRMTNLFGKAVGISPDEYRYYRSQCINKCEKELGRGLYLWEKEMICYPQVCHTCYESDIQKLTTCQKCHHVSYCKLSHLKTDHDVWCKEFQVYRDITLYQSHHGIIQPSLPDRSLQQCAPLTGDMTTFLLNTNAVSEKSLLSHRLHLVALSDTATCPLTVLFSLQKCISHLEDIKALTIHLVGAEMQFEVHTLQKWELLLLHLIPSLRTLKVVFIGPELEAESDFIQTLGKNETCSKCNTAGRMVIYEFWNTLYHTFVTSLNYQKPDLICAFNAGLYRLTDFEGKDTWSPTIKTMFEDPDIHVAVTEYTDKELPFDLQRIQSIVDSLQIIMPPTRNPFASLKPSLNFLSEEMVPVIFKNFYITILKGGKIERKKI